MVSKKKKSASIKAKSVAKAVDAFKKRIADRNKIIQLVPPMSYSGDDVLNGVPHVRYYPKDGSAAQRVAVEAWALLVDGSVVALVRDESMTRLVLATDLVEKYGELHPQSVERFKEKTVLFHSGGASAVPFDINENFEPTPPDSEDLNYSGREAQLLGNVKRAIASGDTRELAQCFGILLAPDRLYQQSVYRYGGTIEDVIAEARKAAGFHREGIQRNAALGDAPGGTFHDLWLPLIEKFIKACEPETASAQVPQ